MFNMLKYVLFVLFLELTCGADQFQCEGEKKKDSFDNLASKIHPEHPGTKHVTYTAAVLEYEPYNKWSEQEKGFGIVRRNANNLVSYASEAKKQGAEILITPEYGIASGNPYEYELEDFVTFAHYVPDPSERKVPCDFSGNLDHLEAIIILSCGAESNAIYLASNLLELVPCSPDTISKAPWHFDPLKDCPEEGFLIYNTEVVFDRKGMLIVRYRKLFVYTEEVVIAGGPRDEASAIFVTDFDVAFSVQICYDSLFEGPGYRNVRNYGIRDVIMSTMWVDELPFCLADAIQNGWSQGLGANFLVSGLHYPEHYALGSGIYRSYSNDSVVYSYNKDSGSVLLVASMKTVAASDLDLTSKRKSDEESHFKRKRERHQRVEPIPATVNINQKNRFHSRFHQDLSEFTRITLKPGVSGEVLKATGCHDDEFCCDLSYQYTGKEIYKFLVFSGRSYIARGKHNIGVQQCGVVWCKSSNYETCAHVELGLPESDFFGPFEISSSSFQGDVVFPIGNHRNLSLIENKNLEFKKKDDSFSIKAKNQVKDHLTAALFGRWFSKDVIYGRIDP